MDSERSEQRTEAETIASSAAEQETVEQAALHRAPPETIGHYRIKRLIAEGGMGAVYEAVQEQPRRTVALKIIKAGISSRSTLRRFLYESQVLGRLRHPGIAQIYEAGTHDDGSGGVPYFAMEYIPGAKTLTEYVQQHHLETREKLELFVKVCDAVHHGHQKGIIHRDLKPHNILCDSSGQPKIIDFGIARATDSDLAVTTLQTQVGELVGTVQYMSPEQCEADPNDLDIRSDVYALGMILYEVLCGRLPYDVTHVGLIEATRVIREAPPTPLSPMNSELKGDIETIVFKALAKERDRRYESAASLANDINRYLKNEPIQARPPSLVYQARLFARRHTAIVAGAAAGVIALAIGLVGTTLAMVRAMDAEAVAVRESAVANETLGFFRGGFSQLDARNAPGGAGASVTVASVLDSWSHELEDRYQDLPEVKSTLLRVIGDGYHALAMHDDAQRIYEDELALRRAEYGDTHEKVASALRKVGAMKWWRGRVNRNHDLFVEAENDFRTSLEMYRALLEPPHEEIANGLNYLAAAYDAQNLHEEASPLYEEALEMRQALADQVKGDPEQLAVAQERVARSLNNFGTCLRNQGLDAEFAGDSRRAIALYDQAQKHFRDAITIVSRLHSSSHLDVGNGSANLARTLHRRAVSQGSAAGLDEAIDLYEQSVRIKSSLQGPDHTAVAETELQFADLLLFLEQYDDAERHADEAIRIWSIRLPEDHWRLAATRSVVGAIRIGQERYDDAETLLVNAFKRLQRTAVEDVTLEYDDTLDRLEMLYERAGKPDEAARYAAIPRRGRTAAPASARGGSSG